MKITFFDNFITSEKIEGPRKTIVSLPVQPSRMKMRVKIDIGITKVLDWISSKTELLP